MTIDVPVCTGSFATMIEETIIVVLVLKWKDGGINEGINPFDERLQLRWRFEVHGCHIRR